MKLLVQDKSNGYATLHVTLAMAADAPFCDVRAYVEKNYPHFHIVSRA